MIPGNANPLLLASAADAAAADVATKSLRFNRGDSAHLIRTPSSAGNRRTFTISFWVKRTGFGTDQSIFSTGTSASLNGNTNIKFETDNAFRVVPFDLSGSGHELKTSAILRDPSSFYHCVIAYDTTQATSSNRAKIYINGVEAALSTANYPSQNAELGVNSNIAQVIGRYNYGTTNYLDAYVADFYLIDGSQLDATSFGAFDDNGVWQAAAYSGTYGTNGFHLDFADSSDLGDDNSGNGNDWTPNNLTGHTVQTYPGVAIDGPTNGGSTATGYLSIPASNSSDFNFGTGDFTWEAFVLSYDWTGGSSNDDQFVIAHAPSAGGDISGLFVDGGQSYYYSNKASSRNIITGPTLEDGRWYHIAASRDNGTLRLFVDGVSQGSASYTDDYADAIFTLGRNEDNDKNQFRGVISNFRVLKGTALYTSNFTVPTTPLTNITNTKLLCCQSSSSVTTATVTPATIVANGDTDAVQRSDSRPANDSLFDVPTNGTQSDTGAGGEVSGNYATLNPLAKSTNVTLSNGNLDYTAPNAASTYGSALSTIGVSSGKWYAEYVWTSGSTNSHVGIATGDINLETWLGNNAGAYTYFATGIKYNNGTSASYGASYANGDVIGVAFDADNGTLEFYKNGTSQGTAYTGLTNGPYFFGTGMGTAGQTATFNFGQRAFAYSAPSGYKALCTTNLPTPTIADGSDYFDTALYTGNGANSRTISGLGFSPDFLWVKNRDNTAGDFSHRLMDAVRGAGIALSSNSNAVERDNSAQPGGGVETFTSDGFTIEQGTSTNDNQNKNNSTYVAWAWDAGSSTVSNTNGSITSSVRANQTAGFSIVSYTGDGSTTTWGHGLSVAPKLIFFKRRNNANNWFVLADLGVHSGFSVFEGLNNTNAAGDYSSNASASNTIVTLPNTTDWNASGGTYIAYCFSPVASYSAMGSYEGNNSSDGPYVYTGFKVAFLLVKNADGSHPWNIFDAARSPDNVITKGLQPNSSGAEYDSTDRVDFLSNGFKIRSSGSTEPNLSGNTYIYYAVAENPFQANGGLAR